MAGSAVGSKRCLSRRGYRLGTSRTRRSRCGRPALKLLIDAHGEDFPFRIAGFYGYRKEPDKVFEWLERAYALHDPRLISLLADPLLRPHQSDARFAALCKKMGLPVSK